MTRDCDRLMVKRPQHWPEDPLVAPYGIYDTLLGLV